MGSPCAAPCADSLRLPQGTTSQPARRSPAPRGARGLAPSIPVHGGHRCQVGQLVCLPRSDHRGLGTSGFTGRRPRASMRRLHRQAVHRDVPSVCARLGDHGHERLPPPAALGSLALRVRLPGATGLPCRRRAPVRQEPGPAQRDWIARSHKALAEAVVTAPTGRQAEDESRGTIRLNQLPHRASRDPRRTKRASKIALRRPAQRSVSLQTAVGTTRAGRGTQSACKRSRRRPAEPIRDSELVSHRKSGCTGAFSSFVQQRAGSLANRVRPCTPGEHSLN